MELDRFVSLMLANARRIRALAESISDEQARWRPDPTAWSILEVINHLFDEEREDFRVMLDLALHRPDEPRPSIDPEGWAVQRRYNERDPALSLEHFLAARQESLGWLQGLPSPTGRATYQAPFGPITAGDVMASWVAHDLLHMRQLVELHWAYTTQLLAPLNVDYAGSW
jgi:hypothetical protein